MADRTPIWVPPPVAERYRRAAAAKSAAHGGRPVFLNEIACDAIEALEREIETLGLGNQPERTGTNG